VEAPDWVVEIHSPSNRQSQVAELLADYWVGKCDLRVQQKIHSSVKGVIQLAHQRGA